MTTAHGHLRRVPPLWLSAWPMWSLLLFSAVVVARALPGGYIRAVAAVPVLLLIPGSLTVGAVFGGRGRLRGTLFVTYALLLSVLLLAFVSLALYSLHVRITGASTYVGMLGPCALLAVIAQARLVAERRMAGRRTADEPGSRGHNGSGGNSGDAGAKGAIPRFASIVAVVAGAVLLVSAVYFYNHLHRPSSGGYTQLAWSSAQEIKTIQVGRTGTNLYFEIFHQQPGRASFRLSAAWEGSSAHPVTRPLALSIGAYKTFRGDLFVPAPPGPCTYRIVLTLTEIKRTAAATKQQPAWSINANVHNRGEPGSACAP